MSWKLSFNWVYFRVNTFEKGTNPLIHTRTQFKPSPVGWGRRIYQLHLCREVRLLNERPGGPVGRGRRIHRLHLCRGVRLPNERPGVPVGRGRRIHRLHLCRGIRLPNERPGGPVVWGCRIHRLDLCREVRSHSIDCPGYDTKQSDDETSVMLELWRMQSSSSLPLLSGSPDPEW